MFSSVAASIAVDTTQLAACVDGVIKGVDWGVTGGAGIPANTAGSGTGNVSGESVSTGDGAAELWELLVSTPPAIMFVPNKGTSAASGLCISTVAAGSGFNSGFRDPDG